MTQQTQQNQWKRILLNPLLSSVITLKNHIKWFFLIILFDVLFLIFFGFVKTPLVNRITDYMYFVSKGIGRYVVLNPEAENHALTTLIKQSNMQTYAYKIILMLLVLFFCMYVVYVFFQGLSWFYLNKIKKKTDFYDFMLRFAKVTLLWFAFFIIIQIMLYFYSLFTLAQQQQGVDPTSALPNHPIFAIMIWLMLYFGFLSYIFIQKQTPGKAIKTSFILGIKKAQYLIPAFFLGFVLLLVINLILQLVKGSLLLTLVLGFILLFPGFVWFRSYFHDVVEQVQK